MDFTHSTNLSFSSFTPNELVGKQVLWEVGTSYGGTSKEISTITRVLKGGFKIAGNTSTFDLIDGRKKGMHGKMHSGSINRCTLITDEQANYLKLVWQQRRELRELYEYVATNISKVKDNRGKLLIIKNIIDKK